MRNGLRAAVAASILLTSACGWFDEDEDPLPGQRIPVRDYRAVVTGQAAYPPPPAASETELEENAVQ